MAADIVSVGHHGTLKRFHETVVDLGRHPVSEAAAGLSAGCFSVIRRCRRPGAGRDPLVDGQRRMSGPA